MLVILLQAAKRLKFLCQLQRLGTNSYNVSFMAKARKNSSKKPDLRPVQDSDVARLRLLLARKQEYVAVLELELTNTRADLNSFTEIYTTRITPLQRKANHLRKQLFEALEQQRLQEGEDLPFDPGNGRAENAQGGADEEPPITHEQRRRFEHEKTEPEEAKQDPHREERIRTLFRALAKRFHPDLTADPEEKAIRERIMARVNQAYTERNLAMLLKLSEEPDIESFNGSLSIAEEVARIRKELKRLDEVITELELSIRQIDTSPIMQLRLEVYMARRGGRDLLTDMVKDLEMQIADLEEHLQILGVEIVEQPAED